MRYVLLFGVLMRLCVYGLCVISLEFNCFVCFTCLIMWCCWYFFFMQCLRPPSPVLFCVVLFWCFVFDWCVLLSVFFCLVMCFVSCLISFRLLLLVHIRRSFLICSFWLFGVLLLLFAYGLCVISLGFDCFVCVFLRAWLCGVVGMFFALFMFPPPLCCFAFVLLLIALCFVLYAFGYVFVRACCLFSVYD